MRRTDLVCSADKLSLFNEQVRSVQHILQDLPARWIFRTVRYSRAVTECLTIKNKPIMSINYSIAMLGNPIDEDAPKKAYAKSQYTNILTLDKFAGHIASHGSKYNRADIYAVLMQTVDCMREMLLEGKRIEMGDLGVFSISIQSRGAENLETFNPAIHIEQLNVNWTPGDRFRNLLEDAVFNLVPSRRAARILLKSIKAGETTVDLTGGGNEANQPTEGQV